MFIAGHKVTIKHTATSVKKKTAPDSERINKDV